MEFLGLECRDTLPQILFGNDRGAAKAREMLLRKPLLENALRFTTVETQSSANGP